MASEESVVAVIPPMSTAMRLMVLHDIVTSAIGNREMLDVIDLRISECVDQGLADVAVFDVVLSAEIMARWNIK